MPKPTDPIPSLFTRYRVRLESLTRMCASVPADPDLIQAWIAARQPRVKPAGALSIEEINEEVLASIERGEGEATEAYSMLVFQRHDGALVQRAGTVKAHIKDCARVLSAQFIGRIAGERAFSTRVINGVNLDPRAYWLPWKRPDGSPVIQPDGAYDKAIHVKGPRGTFNALKRFEYIDPPVLLEFTLLVLGRSVSISDLHHIFEYGGTHGYGGERGDGEGRYIFELDPIEAPTEERRPKTAHSRGDR